MNCIQLIGRLTADPEAARETEHGAVASFRIAVSSGSNGDRRADFFTVETWQRLAEVCSTYLVEGREVAVEGRLDQREWRDEHDRRRERVVVVARSVTFLRSPKLDGIAPDEVPDDDIPF